MVVGCVYEVVPGTTGVASMKYGKQPIYQERGQLLRRSKAQETHLAEAAAVLSTAEGRSGAANDKLDRCSYWYIVRFCKYTDTKETSQ